MFAVEAEGLRKDYGTFTSLRSCTFQVRRGTVFGLLGPNGAGKTTLLRTMLGFVKPTAGKATVCGFDVEKQSLRVRSQTSYLPGDARLYRAMKGKQILELFGGLHQFGSAKRSIEIASRLDLDHSRRVMFMSTGMRQKLALALVLGCEAPLVVLDEPTANLDPNVRSTILELVREIREQGRTVILSSHIFSDIDDTCDEVAILRGGEFVTQQEMSQVSQTHIVTAQFSSPSKANAFRAEAQAKSFVAYFRLRDEAKLAGNSANATTTMQLHLCGMPSQWLGWLSGQDFLDLNIERAGIQAVYQQYHSETSASLDRSAK